MRHHFHRCAHLRVIQVKGADLGGLRKGGGQILDELCEARKLAPCLGLAECDVACIVTAHPGVDYEEVVRGAPLVVDFRGVTRGIEAENLVRL